MLGGATIVDPSSTVIETGVTLSPRVIVRPFTTLGGTTSIGPDCEVGPCSTILDSQVAEGCFLPHSYIRSASIAAGTHLAPFATVDGDA